MECGKENREDMLKHLAESKPLDEYEDLSFKEIHYLIYDPYCQNSPLSLNETIDPEILVKIPFYNLVKYFLDFVKQIQPIKINTNGNLPLKIIKPIYDQHFIDEDFEDLHKLKFIRHSRSLAVKNARIITDLAGLTITKDKEFNITRKGEKYSSIVNSSKLFGEVIKTFTTQFNWSYNDGFGNNNIGQFGFAYLLRLISNYGNLPRTVKFYIDKYYNVFKAVLINSDEQEFQKDFFHKCFLLRAFYRFLNWFGLIKFSAEINQTPGEYIIEKSDIFDAIIHFD